MALAGVMIKALKLSDDLAYHNDSSVSAQHVAEITSLPATSVARSPYNRLAMPNDSRSRDRARSLRHVSAFGSAIGESPTRTRYFVLAWLCLAATIAYICRNSIGVAESTIRRDLDLSEEAMAWVLSSFFLVYALGQIPASWLGNYWGSRRSIPLFALVWSAATGAMGLATGSPLLLLARVANGAAQAGLFPCATNTISRWFPSSRRAIANGSLASFMSIGGVLGVAITGILVVTIGWRWTFAAFSLLGVLWAVGFFWWFRDLPTEHPWVNEGERKFIGDPLEGADKDDVTSTPWLGIYLSPATWWICSQQFCRAAGHIFFASWFATYLQETRHVSVEQSGLLNSLPLAASILGAFIGGAVSDFMLARCASLRLARSGLAAVSMLLCASLVFSTYFIQQPLLAVMTISLGTFFAAVGGPCAYTVTIDMGGRHIAVLFATMNMSGNLGAFLFIWLVPKIIGWTGSWDGVLALFGILYLAAAAFWLLLNPKGTILDHSLFSSR